MVAGIGHRENLRFALEPARTELRGIELWLVRHSAETTLCKAPSSANLGHVSAIAAHELNTLAAGDAPLLAGELMRQAALVGDPAALARDLSLPRRSHRSEPTRLILCSSLSRLSTLVPRTPQVEARERALLETLLTRKNSGAYAEKLRGGPRLGAAC